MLREQYYGIRYIHNILQCNAYHNPYGLYIYINDSLDASRNNACVFFVCEFVSVCVPCLPNNPDFPEL